VNKTLKRFTTDWDELSFRIFKAGKRLYHFAKPAQRNGGKVVVFIVGCQRSGTSLLTNIFEKDLQTKVYGERSRLSSHDTATKIRLNPLPEVKSVLDTLPVNLIVLKPLVETQNLPRLLEFFPQSKALWMYREYKEVVSSSLKRWGMDNGINNLRPIALGLSPNWRSENIAPETREVVCRYFTEDMNPYDAAALFWYSRNKLYFDLGLLQRDNVKLCKYEDLVTQPTNTMAKVYQYLQKDCPSEQVTKMVHANSVRKKTPVPVSPEIDKLCRDLHMELDRNYHRHWS